MSTVACESGYVFFVFELGQRCDIRYAQIEKGVSFSKLLKSVVNTRYGGLTEASNVALVLHRMFMVPSTIIEPHEIVRATADETGGRFYRKRCIVDADPQYVSEVLRSYCSRYHQFITESLRVPKRRLIDNSYDSPIDVDETDETDEYDTTDGFVVDDDEPIEYRPTKKRLVKVSDKK